MKKLLILSFLALLSIPFNGLAQEFSLGVRSTVSTFSHDGTGLGTGGQFRIQLSERVNTEWFADYILINQQDRIRSDYYHIGWSVLYYPFKSLKYPKHFQPYVQAGHCFDYNRKTMIEDAAISNGRWGSAIQAGLGTHLYLTERFNVSLSCQYMIHLTKTLTFGDLLEQDTYTHSHSVLEGHLLATVSMNYKLFELWKK